MILKFGELCLQEATPLSTDGSVNLTLWQEFCDRSAKCIVNIVQFAKRVPGFEECSTHDQVIMLKAACLDMLVSIRMDFCKWKSAAMFNRT